MNKLNIYINDKIVNEQIIKYHCVISVLSNTPAGNFLRIL